MKARMLKPTPPPAPSSMARWPMGASAMVVVVMSAACGDADKRPIGATCGASNECASGLCYENLCVDPALDDDGDGLTNGLEASLGSSASREDTDGDGILDPAELGPNSSLIDTDGDGEPDITESAKDDEDKDCIPDQFDARNAVPDSDLSPLVDVVCKREGLCGAQRNALSVTCPDLKTPACVYDGVLGYTDPEANCDGVDEDCDGTTDEGFSLADCGPTATPFITTTSGQSGGDGGFMGTGRFRAKLTIGPPIRGDAGDTRFRARFGVNPNDVPK
jgi:hypothetical protein